MYEIIEKCIKMFVMNNVCTTFCLKCAKFGDKIFRYVQSKCSTMSKMRRKMFKKGLKWGEKIRKSFKNVEKSAKYAKNIEQYS